MMTKSNVSKGNTHQIRRGFFWYCLLLGFLFLPMENGMASCFSWIVLGVIGALLWRPGESPALVFALSVQWLQASIVLLYGSITGISAVDYHQGEFGNEAALLCLGGLMFLAMGIRVISGRQDPRVAVRIAEQARSISIRRMFGIWCIAFIIALIAKEVSIRSGGLRQFILPFASLGMIALSLLTYKVISEGKGSVLLGCAVMAELVVQLLGFFSSFKLVFFVLMMGSVAGMRRITARHVFLGASLFLILVFLLVGYTSIKMEYRTLLQGGNNNLQGIAISRNAQVSGLISLVSGITWRNFDEGAHEMLSRIDYTHYFSKVQEQVPDHIPHENGRLWREAIMFVAMPRILFPNKPIVDDSKKTNTYIIEKVAGMDRGTTVSLGYICETFIDFGRIGMMFVMFLLGLFVGWGQRMFVYSAYPFLGMGIVIQIFGLGFHLMESSTTILLGGIVIQCIILWSAFAVFARSIGRIQGHAPLLQAALRENLTESPKT